MNPKTAHDLAMETARKIMDWCFETYSTPQERRQVLDALIEAALAEQRERDARVCEEKVGPDDSGWRNGWVRNRAVNDLLASRAAAIREGGGRSETCNANQIR